MSWLHGPVRRAVVAVLLLGLGSAVVRQPEPERLHAVAEFNRAGLNIRPGDEVRLRGYPIGSIEAIETDRPDFTARYELAIDPSVKVAADTGARVVPKTLFGDKYVELDPAEPGGPTLRDGDVIPVERTAHVAELEGLIDDLTLLFETADPVALGASISAFAEGFGNGEDLRRLSEGFTAGGEEVAARRTELHRLFRSMPGLAGAVERSTGDMVAAARDMGAVMELLASSDDELQEMLSSNAELLSRAGRLFGDPRLERIIADGLTLTDIVRQHPGALQEYFAGVPIYLEGLADAIWYDHLYAVVPHMLIGLPRIDAAGDLADGEDGNGAGPHIVMKPPEYQDPRIDLEQEP